MTINKNNKVKSKKNNRKGKKNNRKKTVKKQRGGAGLLLEEYHRLHLLSDVVHDNEHNVEKDCIQNSPHDTNVDGCHNYPYLFNPNDENIFLDQYKNQSFGKASMNTSVENNWMNHLDNNQMYVEERFKVYNGGDNVVERSRFIAYINKITEERQVVVDMGAGYSLIEKISKELGEVMNDNIQDQHTILQVFDTASGNKVDGDATWNNNLFNKARTEFIKLYGECLGKDGNGEDVLSNVFPILQVGPDGKTPVYEGWSWKDEHFVKLSLNLLLEATEITGTRGEGELNPEKIQEVKDLLVSHLERYLGPDIIDLKNLEYLNLLRKFSKLLKFAGDTCQVLSTGFDGIPKADGTLAAPLYLYTEDRLCFVRGFLPNFVEGAGGANNPYKVFTIKMIGYTSVDGVDIPHKGFSWEKKGIYNRVELLVKHSQPSSPAKKLELLINNNTGWIITILGSEQPEELQKVIIHLLQELPQVQQELPQVITNLLQDLQQLNPDEQQQQQLLQLLPDQQLLLLQQLQQPLLLLQQLPPNQQLLLLQQRLHQLLQQSPDNLNNIFNNLFNDINNICAEVKRADEIRIESENIDKILPKYVSKFETIVKRITANVNLKIHINDPSVGLTDVEITELFTKSFIPPHGSPGVTTKIKLEVSSLRDIFDKIDDGIQKWDSRRGGGEIASNYTGVKINCISLFVDKIKGEVNATFKPRGNWLTIPVKGVLQLLFEIPVNIRGKPISLNNPYNDNDIDYIRGLLQIQGLLPPQ